ncbi:hypothetical protein HYU16_02935 [Candidatus Woesearchaeota archaeon]|nr:hypothetical protein [Candidatus Woesearchaeota archaeon]
MSSGRIGGMGRMRKNKRGAAPTSLLMAIGYALGFILFVLILQIAGGKVGLTIGGTAEAATAIDRGFADLTKKAEELEDSKPPVDFALTVDKDFFLVSFNKAPDVKNGNAVSPPECNGVSCLCVCIDDKCEDIDVQKNRGRDCRPIYQYNAIIAEGDDSFKCNDGSECNRGGKHTSYKYVDESGSVSDGYYFYIKGEKTFSAKIRKSSSNLYIGQ